MRRGTTPTITITTDIDLTSAINMFVTFKQNDRIVFEKTLADVEITSESVICNLTQEDTLLLKSGGIVRYSGNEQHGLLPVCLQNRRLL